MVITVDDFNKYLEALVDILEGTIREFCQIEFVERLIFFIKDLIFKLKE